MNKLNLLSRAEMKKVMGGRAAIGGGCVTVTCNNGESSCWYTRGATQDLFERVCGKNTEGSAIEHFECPSGCNLN